MFENDESPCEPFTLIFGHNHIIGKIGNEKIVNRKTGEELSIVRVDANEYELTHTVKIERKLKVPWVKDDLIWM